MDPQLIFQKYKTLPGNFQHEVANFIEFLVAKYQKQEQLQGNEPATAKKPVKRKSNFCNAKGLIIIADDFDNPLEDFKEYM